MAELPRHRPQSARLPKQPLQHLEACGLLFRQQHSGLFGQVNENGATLKDGYPRIGIDDGRHPVIRADTQEFRIKLIAVANIHGLYFVVQPAFLEHDRNLVSVRRRPVVKFYHEIQYMMFSRQPLSAAP